MNNAGSYLNRTTGFTLLELMLVLLIVSIFSLFAVPIYTDMVKEKRWDEGKAKLLEVLLKQDAFKLTDAPTFSYTMDLTDLGYDSSNLGSRNDGRGDHAYYITLSLCSNGLPIGQCVKVIATPDNDQDPEFSVQSNDLEIKEN